MGLSFTCERCGEDVGVRPNDDIPGIKLKLIRVERSCRACGQMVKGANTPEVCPNESCPEPHRGFAPAERIVSESVELAVCTACQDDLDTEAELAAALAESV